MDLYFLWKESLYICSMVRPSMNSYSLFIVPLDSRISCLLHHHSSLTLQFEAVLSSISKMPFKSCPSCRAGVRMSGDDVGKIFQRRPEQNKCLRNVCFIAKHTYDFFFCEVTTGEHPQAKPALQLWSERSPLQRGAWPLTLFPGR